MRHDDPMYQHIDNGKVVSGKNEFQIESRKMQNE